MLRHDLHSAAHVRLFQVECWIACRYAAALALARVRVVRVLLPSLRRR
ncbi:hypothetical protein [Stenotrophomonas tuberculopleuritidis]|nr:hypothetical protein [Stenotrophomonas sp. 704A1]